MVRNPISHLVSWKKAGYEMVNCTKQSWESIMSSDCSFGRPIRHHPVTFHFKAPGLVNVWNVYVKGYLELAKRHENFLIVRYEDLVVDPDAVVRALAQFEGVKVPEHIEHVGPPAKKCGSPEGRSAALQKILQHEYLFEETEPVKDYVPQICASVDWSLVERLPKLVEDVPSYNSDCL
mmetsp:Transcript_25839/g.35993  ORF Transcript_25839/g.35993 Transcript_25839/m.35993 type:complete len:178 (-) Transcript_25839:214-747(-)